jgi:AcrR family transcriptional regulator
VQNTVPATPAVEFELADQALAERREAYALEVRRLLDAAFEVMRRTGDVDPQVRDIVKTAGLSNQSFYRHFASKDALMVAVLADGQRQLVDHLRRRVASTKVPLEQLRRWITGVLAQARDAQAADATRPFAINGARLADRYPTEVEASRAQLLTTLVPIAVALGGDEHDAELVHDLAMQRLRDALALRRAPDDDEVERLVQFCLAGIQRAGGAHGA